MSGGGQVAALSPLVASKEKAVSLADLLREKGAVNTWIESL